MISGNTIESLKLALFKAGFYANYTSKKSRGTYLDIHRTDSAPITRTDKDKICEVAMKFSVTVVEISSTRTMQHVELWEALTFDKGL